MAKQTLPDGYSLGQSSGYWKLTWRDNVGRTHSRSMGNAEKTSRMQAMQKARRIIAQHQKHPAAAASGKAPTLESWVNAYPEGRGYSESTQGIYRQVGALLVRHFGPSRRLDQITRDDAARWKSWLPSASSSDNRPIGEQTARKLIRHAKRIFEEAFRRDLIAYNPMDRLVGSPLQAENTKHYLTMEELDRLLESSPGPGWRCLWAVTRLAGLRVGEARRLRWGDIDWERRSLTVVNPHKTTTTKHRTRVVPIQPKLLAVLQEAFDQADAGESHPCYQGVNNVLRNAKLIIRRAGLVPWGKPFHSLRASCETDWLEQHALMDVCAWLGNSPAVAQRHYHRTRAEAMAKVSQPENEVEALRQRVAELEAENERLRAELSGNTG